MSNYALPPFYYRANALLRHILFPLLMPVTIQGQEHVPPAGPLIVVVNHINIIEAPMLGAFFPRGIVMMSKVENFDLPFWGHIVRYYGAFPINRGEADVQAIKRALRVLRGGAALLVAPEGTRGPPGLREGRHGAALLAALAPAPIIPVGISGHEHFGANLKRLRRTPATLAIGPAFTLASPTRHPSRDTLRAMTTEIMQRLAAQLPPTHRGIYQAVTGPGEFVRPLAELPVNV
jgi:1-acyl-sn-glycerol-3-phosphate acyltransferase